MKPSFHRMFHSFSGPCSGVLVAFCITGSTASAANLDHVLSSTSGTWAAATWTNGVPADNPGDIASYGGASSTISLGSAVTIGVLRGAMSGTGSWGISATSGVAFTMDGTGISSANNPFSSSNTAAIVNSSGGGTLTVRPNLILKTSLDIGTTGSGVAIINIGSATANDNTITNAVDTALALNFRLNTGTGNMNIGSSIGVTGVDGGLINISNLGTAGTGAVVVSGNLGTYVGSVVQNSANSRMILSGANSYTGAYTITSGALSFATRTSLYNADTSQWTAANIQVAAGGTLGLGFGAASGSFTEDEIKAFNDGAFLPTGARLGIEVASGNTGTYSKVISNANGGLNTIGFTKLGAGTLILTGANTYTGNTTISGGTLRLSVAQGETSGPLGGGTGGLPTGTIHFNGGTLQYSATNTTDYSSRFSTAAGNAVSIDTNGQTVTFANGINSTTGTLTKTGTGTLILTAASTMSNGSVVTNINGGTLRGVDSNVYAAGTNTLLKIFGTGSVQIANNATLDARADGLNDSSTQTLTYGNQIQVSSTGATYNINVDRASATGGTNKIIAFGSHNIGANTTMNLTGGNGYSLSINQLQLGGGGTADAVMTMNPTTANLLIAGVSGGSQTASPTLKLAGSSLGNVISGAVANPNATAANRTSLIKSGTSIWTLNGTNTYTGTTTVESGTLVVNGSIAASTAASPTTVIQAAGTLAGTGTINNAVNISGIVAPGALNGAAGKLTINSSVAGTANFSTGGNLLWSITSLTDLASAAGTSYDELTLSGMTGLTLGGTSSLTLSFNGGAADPNSGDTFWTTARSWKIINNTGTGTNAGLTNFSQITNANYSSGSFTTLADPTGSVYLNFTPVPEPGTAALLAVALGLSARRRRND